MGLYFNNFCMGDESKDKNIMRRLHDYITKKGYDSWQSLEDAWLKFIGGLL